MVRDLIGYGSKPPKITWPADSKIAVSLTVNYEEGSERVDGQDFLTRSTFEYGSRVGIWRLLDLFEKYKVPATFFACGRALEQNPEAAKQIVERGNEIASQGYRLDDEQFSLEASEEKDYILKATKVIKETTGERPHGWFSNSGPTHNTRELLVEQGFTYDSLGINDDLPHVLDVKNAKLVVIPYSLDTNDINLVSGGFSSTRDFYDYVKGAFEWLYNRGEVNHGMISIILHPRIIARPGRISVLEELLAHMQSRSSVWFPKRIEIARWWLVSVLGR
jgi:peptidoglycan/xylan/chitin deacetylase (PgdA/CDA1 family)